MHAGTFTGGSDGEIRRIGKGKGDCERRGGSSTRGVAQFMSLEISRKDAYNMVCHAMIQPAGQLPSLLSSTGISGLSESDAVETLDEAKETTEKEFIVVYDEMYRKEVARDEDDRCAGRAPHHRRI